MLLFTRGKAVKSMIINSFFNIIYAELISVRKLKFFVLEWVFGLSLNECTENHKLRPKEIHQETLRPSLQALPDYVAISQRAAEALCALAEQSNSWKVVNSFCMCSEIYLLYVYTCKQFSLFILIRFLLSDYL